MVVSDCSIIMAILCFSLTVLIGSLVLRHADKSGIILSEVIFLFAIARLVVPVEFFHVKLVYSNYLYPMVQKLAVRQIFGCIRIIDCILIAWAVGILVRLVLLVRKLYLQIWFRRFALYPDAESKWMKIARRVCRELGYEGKLTLAISLQATTAYQAGFFQPYILLPGNIDSFTEKDVRYILRHELYHFLGFDLWIKLFFQSLTCFLWWNPAMILLNKEVEHLLELRCDRRACRDLTEAEKLGYLDTLLCLAKNDSATPQKVSLGFSGNCEDANIRQRFHILIQRKTTRSAWAKAFAGMAVCFVLFVTSYCFLIQPMNKPSLDEIGDENFQVLWDESYITRSPSGTLILFYEGDFCGWISEEDLMKEPYCNYEIYDIYMELPGG